MPPPVSGIDVPEGPNGLLAGMRTVHYGTIPDMTTQDGNGSKRRLFLKCETHGCFHNPISKENQAAGMTPNMHQREARDGDWSESILHTFSFLGTRGADPTAGGARFLQKKTDKNGGMDYGIKITIPRADLDRLGSADWTHYDPKQVNEALGDTNLPNRFSTAENLVPNQFRFTGSVDVTCEIRATSLHDLGEDL